MTRYIANITETLRPGIHKVATIEDNAVIPVADLPAPKRVEIVLEGGRQDPCMLYRYTDVGEHCGDTWHENLAAALSQAEFEYGLAEADFAQVNDAEK